MKRRVIQHGRSTMIVSLPSTWVKKFGIDKGDEVEIQEKGNLLEVSVGSAVDFGTIGLDVSELDTELIDATIKSAYIQGFEEIIVNFPRPYIEIEDKLVDIKKIVRDATSNLVGVEITIETSTNCVIKELSGSSSKEFDNVLRRIFLLIREAINNIKETKHLPKNAIEKENLKQECKSIQELVYYCLRCLNRYGYHQFKKSHSVYHILASSNAMVGELVNYVETTNPGCIDEQLLEKLEEAVKYFSKFFFKFQKESLVEISRLNKELTFENCSKKGNNSTSNKHLSFMMGLVWDMTLYRIAL